jgi:DNA-binding IclR family transcriptional regulator
VNNSTFDAIRQALSALNMHATPSGQALAEHGLLEVSAGGSARLGLRLWELVVRNSPTLALRQAAMPFMEDIRQVLNQNVDLTVLPAALGCVPSLRAAARRPRMCFWLAPGNPGKHFVNSPSVLPGRDWWP